MGVHIYEISGVNIVHEIIGDEVVAVNLDSGKYYSIKGTGAYLWGAIISGHDLEKIITQFTHFYPENTGSIVTDIQQFVDRLIAEGLIRNSDGLGSEADIKPVTSVYETPALEIYSDMQEILLLDPVHDVDESGWPITDRQK